MGRVGLGCEAGSPTPRFRAYGWAGLGATLAAAVALSGCAEGEPDRSAGAARDGPAAVFVEVTEAWGLEPPDEHWPDGTWALPEIMPPGLGVLDYDGDGDLDLVRIGVPPPGRPGDPAPNRLFRREADGTYRDVTAASGLGDPGFGQGIAAGDVDGDGDVDVYFTNYGPDAFYRNDGDGTFTEATAEAGLSGDGWSASATFCDYDRDGDLDLFVTHYVRYDADTACVDSVGKRDYCAPNVFPGQPDTMYRNEGDGTFTDVTRAAGIDPGRGGERARGLGAVCMDLTRDGWADLYVANDGESNHLWVNQRDGTFADEGVMRGVAVNRHGTPEASMGLAVADVNDDGSFDLYMTHLFSEHNRLYLGGAGALFGDRTEDSHVGHSDLSLTGFGCAFLDHDLDGDVDLAVANGKVRHDPSVPVRDTGDFWKQYAEPNLFLDNVGGGVFDDAGARAGSFADGVEISRGLIAADLDDDGDPDLAVAGIDGGIRLYRNDAPRPGAHWLRVRAVTGRRDALGAEVTLRAGGRERRGVALRGTSYMSTGDPRVHFGLGEVGGADEVEVLWPDGSVERFPLDGARGDVVVRQGTGAAR